MAWCKTNVSDFFGWNFFSSKVPECLHVLFNLVVKHSPDKRRANRGKNKTRGKIQDFNIKNHPPRTRAFITTSTHTNQWAKNLKNGFLLLHLVAFIVHASIFCPRFTQKQSAKRPKKIQGNVLLLNWKAHAKLQPLLNKKNSLSCVSLTPSHSIIHIILLLCKLANANTYALV